MESREGAREPGASGLPIRSTARLDSARGDGREVPSSGAKWIVWEQRRAVVDDGGRESWCASLSPAACFLHHPEKTR